ncbi:hypothetical protein OG921_20160 [Aldersonia sp. NBC_00410]|uniref:hypothetical protein n=1 Tax=Aldersonia sp. NBC_00410 TaxID=2975954 RepID=UPI0022513C2A|nr:hypothetical protein [Aldersonia sp. NBC_00410]MCX5045487.1 hypothetical protein [Aldersonia sp. NBC_00410]
MATPTHAHPMLRLILRMDRAGSAYFVGMGVLTAPVLMLADPPEAIVWLMWVGWIGFAVWLAALGVFMAWGLTRSAMRGEELDEDWWRSMIDYPADSRR